MSGAPLRRFAQHVTDMCLLAGIDPVDVELDTGDRERAPYCAWSRGVAVIRVPRAFVDHAPHGVARVTAAHEVAHIALGHCHGRRAKVDLLIALPMVVASALVAIAYLAYPATLPWAIGTWLCSLALLLGRELARLRSSRAEEFQADAHAARMGLPLTVDAVRWLRGLERRGATSWAPTMLRAHPNWDARLAAMGAWAREGGYSHERSVEQPAAENGENPETDR